jgi:uncharacterized membrane protein
MSDDGDEGNDPLDWQRLGRIATKPDGSFHWDRIERAIRGRHSREDGDLTIFLLAAALFTVVAPLVAAFVADFLGIGPLWTAGIGVVVLLGVAAQVVDRIDDYYASDEGVVAEELRYRYAAGALSFAEFEDRIERLIEHGPEAVEAGPGPESEDERSAESRDPVAVLRERYAHGEIDEQEYRERMRVLDEGERSAGLSTE